MRISLFVISLLIGGTQGFLFNPLMLALLRNRLGLLRSPLLNQRLLGQMRLNQLSFLRGIINRRQNIMRRLINGRQIGRSRRPQVTVSTDRLKPGFNNIVNQVQPQVITVSDNPGFNNIVNQVQPQVITVNNNPGIGAGVVFDSPMANTGGSNVVIGPLRQPVPTLDSGIVSNQIIDPLQRSQSNIVLSTQQQLPIDPLVQAPSIVSTEQQIGVMDPMIQSQANLQPMITTDIVANQQQIGTIDPMMQTQADLQPMIGGAAGPVDPMLQTQPMVATDLISNQQLGNLDPMLQGQANVQQMVTTDFSNPQQQLDIIANNQGGLVDPLNQTPVSPNEIAMSNIASQQIGAMDQIVQPMDVSSQAGLVDPMGPSPMVETISTNLNSLQLQNSLPTDPQQQIVDMNNMGGALQQQMVDINNVGGGMQQQMVDMSNMGGGMQQQMVDMNDVAGAMQPQLIDMNNVGGAIQPQMTGMSNVGGAMQQQMVDMNNLAGAMQPQLIDMNNVGGAMQPQLVDMNNVGGAIQQQMVDMNNVGGALQPQMTDMSNVGGAMQQQMVDMNNVGGAMQPQLVDMNNVGGAIRPQMTGMSNVGGAMQPQVIDMNNGGGAMQQQMVDMSNVGGAMQQQMVDMNNVGGVIQPQMANNAGGAMQQPMVDMNNVGGAMQQQIVDMNNVGGVIQPQMANNAGGAMQPQVIDMNSAIQQQLGSNALSSLLADQSASGNIGGLSNTLSQQLATGYIGEQPQLALNGLGTMEQQLGSNVLSQQLAGGNIGDAIQQQLATNSMLDQQQLAVNGLGSNILTNPLQQSLGSALADVPVIDPLQKWGSSQTGSSNLDILQQYALQQQLANLQSGVLNPVDASIQQGNTEQQSASAETMTQSSGMPNSAQQLLLQQQLLSGLQTGVNSQLPQGSTVQQSQWGGGATSVIDPLKGNLNQAMINQLIMASMLQQSTKGEKQAAQQSGELPSAQQSGEPQAQQSGEPPAQQQAEVPPQPEQPPPQEQPQGTNGYYNPMMPQEPFPSSLPGETYPWDPTQGMMQMGIQGQQSPWGASQSPNDMFLQGGYFNGQQGQPDFGRQSLGLQGVETSSLRANVGAQIQPRKQYTRQMNRANVVNSRPRMSQGRLVNMPLNRMTNNQQVQFTGQRNTMSGLLQRQGSSPSTTLTQGNLLNNQNGAMMTQQNLIPQRLNLPNNGVANRQQMSILGNQKNTVKASAASKPSLTVISLEVPASQSSQSLVTGSITTPSPLQTGSVDYRQAILDSIKKSLKPQVIYESSNIRLSSPPATPMQQPNTISVTGSNSSSQQFSTAGTTSQGSMGSVVQPADILQILDTASVSTQAVPSNGQNAQTELGNGQNVQTALGNGQNVQTAIGNGQNVQTVLGNGQNVQTLLSNGQNTQTTLGSGQTTQTVSSNGQNVQTVLDNGQNVQTLLGNEQTAQTISGNGQSVQSVAGNGQNIQTAVDNGQIGQTITNQANPSVDAMNQQPYLSQTVPVHTVNGNGQKIEIIDLRGGLPLDAGVPVFQSNSPNGMNDYWNQMALLSEIFNHPKQPSSPKDKQKKLEEQKIWDKVLESLVITSSSNKTKTVSKAENLKAPSVTMQAHKNLKVENSSNSGVVNDPLITGLDVQNTVETGKSIHTTKDVTSQPRPPVVEQSIQTTTVGLISVHTTENPPSTAGSTPISVM